MMNRKIGHRFSTEKSQTEFMGNTEPRTPGVFAPSGMPAMSERVATSGVFKPSGIAGGAENAELGQPQRVRSGCVK